MTKAKSYPVGEDAKSIGRRLNLARRALGMDSGEFAKKAGVLSSAMSMYENGERPCSLANAKKFAALRSKRTICDDVYIRI